MTQVAQVPFVDDSLYAMEAEFYTERFSVRAEVTSAEFRLSDHLNSSLPTVDVRPCTLNKTHSHAEVDLSGTYGPLTKSRLLFVVPLMEPSRQQGATNYAWKKTVTRDCWIALGSYTMAGKIHIDASCDTRVALRLLDKQFIAITDVTIACPDSSQQHFRAVLVNRLLTDLLALKEEDYGPRSHATYDRRR